ncbi:MAG: hypothetical protein U0325_28680 [Polyangiales bacterium]
MTDARCPFCASALPNSLAQRAVPNTTQRLSRAAAFAFTASLAVTGCSSSPTPGTDASTSDAVSTDRGNVVDAVSPSDAGTPTDTPAVTDSGAPQDNGGAMPLYGAPADVVIPPADVQDAGAVAPLYGGPPVDAGAETDVPATPDDGGGIAPLYGAPADAGGGGVRYGAPPPPDAF